MKTIRIEFQLPDGTPLAAAIGRFSVVPGRGSLEWEQKAALEAMLAPPYQAPLPDFHYADLFQDAMEGLAERHNLVAKVSSTGEWEVFDE